MTLAESQPNELVKVKVDFVKPLEGSNELTFAFKPDGDKTAVSWTVAAISFLAKAFCLVMQRQEDDGRRHGPGPRQHEIGGGRGEQDVTIEPMTLLIIGIVVFLGIHLVPTFRDVRERLIGRLGETGYGRYSALVSTSASCCSSRASPRRRWSRSGRRQTGRAGWPSC